MTLLYELILPSISVIESTVVAVFVWSCCVCIDGVNPDKFDSSVMMNKLHQYLKY